MDDIAAPIAAIAEVLMWLIKMLLEWILGALFG